MWHITVLEHKPLVLDLRDEHLTAKVLRALGYDDTLLATVDQKRILAVVAGVLQAVGLPGVAHDLRQILHLIVVNGAPIVIQTDARDDA